MNKTVKILARVAGVVILLFLLYQMYTLFYVSIKTESAVFYEYTDGIKTTGYIIRDERPIQSDYTGTLHFAIADGEKVAKGGVIADIYASDSGSAAATRIGEIDKQLAQIEEIEGYNDLTAVDLNTINAKIAGYLDRYIFETSDGEYSDLSTSLTNLLMMMTRKKVATGEQSDFSAIKTALSSERAELQGTVGTPKGHITADVAGYFISTADGYESRFTTDDLSVYTPEYFHNMTPTAVDSTVVGKIVYDYRWYIAATVSLSDSKFYKPGDVVTLKTTSVSNPRLTATVERINLSESGSDAVIVFSCTEMSSDLASMRSGEMTLIREEYKGLKVATKSLRVVDGATGVFVVSGVEAKFVAVDILYSNDDYAICALNSVDSGKLRLYDEVIVKGKNLYDGKIIY